MQRTALRAAADAERWADVGERAGGSDVLILFSGSGSQEIQLLEPSLSPPVWSRTRAKAVRFMRNRGRTEEEYNQNQRAAGFLESQPFELLNGTNSFGDEFVLLYADLPETTYVEMMDLEADPAQRALFRRMADGLAHTDTHVRFIAVALGEELSPGVVLAPSPAAASDVLEQALADVERALASGRPASAIDRVHTALHAYLRDLARVARLPVTPDTGMPELFKVLRKSHVALLPAGPRREDLERIMSALATIVDALNPLRNKASLAHPTDQLLADAEAMLAINAVRTLFHYLEMRQRPGRGSTRG